MDVTGAAQAWIRRYHRAGPDAARLCCFPHAGGSASFYFGVSAALAPVVDVLAVQYPGRQERRRERPLESVHDLADRIAPVLAATGADRPLALFGHSMGAAVAFEVAVRLERDSDVKLAALFVSGRRAPSRVRTEDVHRRGDAGLLAEIRSLEGTDARMLADEEVVQMILPALRADYTAIETYRAAPGARVRCPIAVLFGDRDPQVNREDAEAWRRHTTGEVTLHAYPGGHFYLTDHRAELVETVAAALRDLGG